MLKFFIFALLICSLQGMVFAQAEGPVTSGGPIATENLISKLKIKALLEAINHPNEVILGIEKRSGNLYVVKIKQDECTRKDIYVVKSVSAHPVPVYEARFLDLEGNPVCK